MDEIEKVMLAVPNNRWFDNRNWHGFPYTLGVMSSVLKDRYDVRVLDANLDNLSPEETRAKIAGYHPDVVGISCMSMEYTRHFQKLASLAKEACPTTKVVVGGIYPTLVPEALMKHESVDFAVLGEGERRFRKLLSNLGTGSPRLDEVDGLAFRDGSKIVVQPVLQFITNLDELPFPDYDSVDFMKYANQANKYSYYTKPNRFPFAQTITSRGCPLHCIFCSSEAINGKGIRYRSSENVLQEIDWLVGKYGVKEILFLDDNLHMDRKRADAIFNGLVERKHDLEWKCIANSVYTLDDKNLELMRKSGCYQLSLAIESGTETGLKRLKKPVSILSKIHPIVKKAKSLDYEIGAMFVIGTPGETWSEIRESFRLAEELDLDYCAFNIATPLPRTELYEIAKSRHLLPADFDFGSLDFKGFGKARITTDEFTAEELQIVRAFEWDRINFKTAAKSEKIARMTGLTLEEVNEWRKSTRRGLGVRVSYKD